MENNYFFKKNLFRLGFVNRRCKFPRGKVMGGSSVLNYMIYTRGNRNDYDNWAKMGNAGKFVYQDRKIRSKINFESFFIFEFHL